ncbi:ABC transporter [Sinomonas cellulolyticus]|uniref:ABC transporter permease n=1 Tax=Sinomonas cellulolyticus TaxID=2801916 RepID=A0ABS1K103_9MICC|nr:MULTISPECIES: ABC transporter permease [Sinomonas]MBL0705349.1 ABC transporter permease [Sinomonas cellulolyticus]GHG40680.1 ABC transporter [Sinomonas sp. KCTC 49339]
MSAATLTRRVWQQGRYETVTMLRNGEQLTLMLILPLFALIGLTLTPVLDGLGHSRIDVAAPGVLALCTMSVGFTGQGIATGFDRRYGVLRFLSTTPLGRGGLIAGKVLAVLVVLAVQIAVIGGVALTLGWHPGVEGSLLGIALLALGAAAFTALGLLIAGTARPEATLAVTNLVWILLGVLGGIVIPAQRIHALAPIVGFLPSGALGDAVRSAFLDNTLNVPAAAILVLWTVLAGVAAIRWFRWS